MYLITQANDRPQQVGLRGLSDPPLPCADKTGKDAIQCALQLNPAGGYVKGSRARRILDAAFASVPPSSAQKLHDQLADPRDTLGKLFRYRLARPTRQTMLKILEGKHREFSEYWINTCKRWQKENKSIESGPGCRMVASGRILVREDPVMCQKLKEQAEKARKPDIDKGIRC